MIILLEGFFALLSGVLLLTSGIENNNSFPHPLSPDKEPYRDNHHIGSINQHQERAAQDRRRKQQAGKEILPFPSLFSRQHNYLGKA